MKKKRKKIKNLPRILIQWSVILFVVFLAVKAALNDNFAADFEAYCPFGGLQAIGSYLLNGSLACTMTSTQMVMGALLLLGVFLFSKLFCSYICPIGTFSEWLGKLGDKLRIRLTIKGIADKALRSLKYILLFVTLYFTFRSNELFCKEYDPFYAIVSGYDSDVNALYATLAIAVTVLGAIFIRLFWCKYLCPLGAISNIFKFGFFFLAVLAIYIGLLLAGVSLHFVWPLAVVCLGGYVIELMGQKSRFFPVAKITRNEASCTSCQLCSLKCPQAIDVASVKVVKHVDCNLCSECITVCPEKDTIQINKRKGLKWMPAITIVALFILGLILQSFIEVPTINQKWGTEEEIASAQEYSREGLKNIKCYGSSMAFASKMQKVKGVYGVSTFVGTHKVHILYDSTIISQAKLEETIFTPNKTVLSALAKDKTEVIEVSALLENFFDAFDYSYLTRLLQQKTEALAVVSEYGCPIKVMLFYPGGEEPDLDELKEILESETLEYEVQGNKRQVELNFEVSGKIKTRTVPKSDYVRLMFSPYTMTFNNYTGYDSSIIRKFSIPLGKNRRVAGRLPYLTSHLSNNDGIVRVDKLLNDSLVEMLEISYVDSMVNADEIFLMMNADSLSVSYSNGKKANVANMFSFDDDEDEE